MRDTDTKTATAPAADSAYIYVTKRVRIPKAEVRNVIPARDCSGDAIIITDRGLNRVCEPYDAVMAQLVGSIPADGRGRNHE